MYTFRAWNGHALEYGGFSIHAGGTILIDTPELTDVTSESEIHMFSGIYDSDGKSIYEEDIVRAVYKNHADRIGRVKLYKGCFRHICGPYGWNCLGTWPGCRPFLRHLGFLFNKRNNNHSKEHTK
jgi:hypothetical protein